MAAYPETLTHDEEAYVRKVTERFVKTFGNAAGRIVWTPAIDHTRQGAYIVVSATVTPTMQNYTWRGANFEEMARSDDGIAGVYLTYSPAERTICYAIDIARTNISPLHICPFTEKPDLHSFALTPSEIREFENENATKTHGKAQLSLAMSIKSLWLGCCTRLIGDVHPDDCPPPDVKCSKRINSRRIKTATARVLCTVQTAADVAWGSHTVEALHYSRYIREVNFHLEVRSDDVIITVEFVIDTPDARSADWTPRKSLRAPPFDISSLRRHTAVAQGAARAALKRKRRPVYTGDQ